MTWIDEALSRGQVPDEIPAEAAPASDREEVSRLLRRLRWIDRNLAQVADDEAREKRLVGEWAERERGPWLNMRRYVMQALEGWTRAEHARTGVQTVRLPPGALELRRRRTSVEVIDERAGDLMDAAALEDLVRTKHEPDKRAIGSVCEAGPVVNELPDEGLVERVIVYRHVNSETGEVWRQMVPGVLLREPMEDPRGLSFTARPHQDDERDLP